MKKYIYIKKRFPITVTFYKNCDVVTEQVNPFANESVSVFPLTWSYAAFINVIHVYLKKYAEFKKLQ
jgi:GH15 family glucan-1,4-alpha-glucosidase